MKKSVCLVFIIILVTVLFTTLPVTPNVTAKTIHVTSRLEVDTFQSSFAYINWYLKANTSDPESSMVAVYSGDLIDKGLPSAPPSLSVFEINNEYDETTSLSTFSIEGAIPIGILSDDFPYDRYEGNYFIGCNYLKDDPTFYLGGNYPGPTDNYQVQWSLTPEPNFMSRISNTTHWMLTESSPNIGNYSTWFHLNILIFHNQEFSQYVGVLVNQVPVWLEGFGVFVAFLVLTPVCIEIARRQPRKIKKGHLIELILIPISVSIIVFIPLYELALHTFESPLVVLRIEQKMIELLQVYLIILGAGIFVRVVTMFRERKPKHTWEETRIID